ncbi:MAG: hypothetical protein QM785_02215 [Pyrinomonadaceae bacterium]
MENYHLFIVDETSFKFHLEHFFVGTGKTDRNGIVSFDIGLWKDIERLRVGDKVVFYLMGLKRFYGVFEVASRPFFHSSLPQYLEAANPSIRKRDGRISTINLRYRALIRPFRVFQRGVDEFDLIDILPRATKDVLWSILYRKLVGTRGCSPIFPSEFEIIQNKLAAVNDNAVLEFESYSFNGGLISRGLEDAEYEGEIARNVDLKQSILRGEFDEHYIHALLMEYLPAAVFGEEVSWFGNEVYSGAAVQMMDLVSISRIKQMETFNVVEIKAGLIPVNIVSQIKKYCIWLRSRFDLATPEQSIQPILIGKKMRNKEKSGRFDSFHDFDKLNLARPIRYIEYSIDKDANILAFNEIDTNSATFDIIQSFEI